MIYQAHFEDVNDITNSQFVAQSGDLQNYDGVRKWMEGVQDRHPLPDGKRWMICDETSACFTRMQVLDAIKT